MSSDKPNNWGRVQGASEATESSPDPNWLGVLVVLLAFLSSFSLAQTQQDTRRSGNSFLSPSLQALNNDPAKNPAQLWVERGQALFQQHCISCHADISSLKRAAATHPKLSANNELRNLEDQIQRCAARPESRISTTLQPESVELLSLSAALHQAAKGERIEVHPLPTPSPASGRGEQPSSSSSTSGRGVFNARLANGERLYNTRMGRMNLACVHCHDHRVGAQMRADVVSEAHPTGFPIYRMSWQTLGSVERRLRACYSGVQAVIPPAGAAELRDLELFLKVRANGMVLDGASVRR